MREERFIQLVREQGGFEFFLAYRDDVDHILGGKGNTFWYTVLKNGRVTETWTGTLRDGAWSDRCVKGRGAKKTEKALPAGSTIRRIAEQAYLKQDEDWVTRRTPKTVRDAHPHFHYVYGFGDRALDVSEAYGVTIGYSDIKDPAAGFHLRDLRVGGDVEP